VGYGLFKVIENGIIREIAIAYELTRYDAIHERDRQTDNQTDSHTDRQTDEQLECHDISRAIHRRAAKKTKSWTQHIDCRCD